MHRVPTAQTSPINNIYRQTIRCWMSWGGVVERWDAAPTIVRFNPTTTGGGLSAQLRPHNGPHPGRWETRKTSSVGKAHGAASFYSEASRK